VGDGAAIITGHRRAQFTWNIGGSSEKTPSQLVNASEGAMKSLVAKRSIAIGGHKTSVTLEEAFWNGLKEIASDRNLTLSELVTAIDTERPNANLSSAIRLFVLDHYRKTYGSAADARKSDVDLPARNPSALHRTGEF
jgi:predicted DNA-binding ribbon-helix-helix protein